jgi:hypothetical protein
MATHPLKVSARGWEDVLFRVWKKIGKDRFACWLPLNSGQPTAGFPALRFQDR